MSEEVADQRGSQLRRVFFITSTSLSVGLVCLVYLPVGAWSKSILMVVLAVIIGLAMSVLGGGLFVSIVAGIRFPMRPSLGRTIVCFLVMGSVGVAYGFLAVEPARWLPQNHWSSMEPPPGRIEELVGMCSPAGGLVVRTSTGEFSFLPDSSGSAKVWRRGHLLGEPIRQNQDGGWYPSPRPLGKVAMLLHTQEWHVDSNAQADYVVLEDGSLWECSRVAQGMTDLFLSFFGVVIGGISGVLGARGALSRADGARPRA